MRWNKFGLIFNPAGRFDWAQKHALQPTPLLMDDRIRVFVGLRDQDGVSRIGAVDLDIHDPRNILKIHPKPILDVGDEGCFDADGVVPSAVVAHSGQIYLYYAGYLRGARIRFTVFGGVAVSDDGGNTFSRAQKHPAFERRDGELLFRVPHSVYCEDGLWKSFYGAGDHFIQGATKTLPVYDIRYTESDSPFNFPERGRDILKLEGSEYRIGRPFLFKRGENDYCLFYGYSTEESPYQLGYATSKDMQLWERRDQDMGLPLATEGWESGMLAYPSLVRVGSKVFIFYNGRNYGEDGFGAAELLEW